MLRNRTLLAIASKYNGAPYLDFGDTIQLRNHLLKEQLDFLEQFQRSSSSAN